MEPPARHLSTKQLVDEFKKSGEFDRLRRQLLTHFASSDEVRPLMSRVEAIVREKLAGDERLEHKMREAVHAEVMEDMERYPIVERAVSQLDIHKDEHLIMSIEQYARNIVHGKGNDATQLWEAKPSRRKRDDEEEDNDGSSDYTEDEDPDDGDMANLTNAKKVEGPVFLATKLEDLTDHCSTLSTTQVEYEHPTSLDPPKDIKRSPIASTTCSGRT